MRINNTLALIERMFAFPQICISIAPNLRLAMQMYLLRQRASIKKNRQRYKYIITIDENEVN